MQKQVNKVPKKRDIFSKRKRSEIMSKIRSKGTKFENSFIALLKKKTHRKFQINVSRIKGKPDLVFLKEKVCIFLDSDFWHGWQYPRWKHILKNEFWHQKIEYNRRRDRNNTHFLRKKGWTVLRFWEHKIKKDPTPAIERILKSL